MSGQTVESVNFIKLTKLEKNVLKALNQPQTEDTKYYPCGNHVLGIAKIVYGETVLNCERRGGHYCSDVSLAYAAKTVLSRVLNGLWKKGLVKKCKPIYHYGWETFEDRDGSIHGCYGKIHELKFLRCVWLNESKLWHIEKLPFKDLPVYCHVWWMLTEKGEHVLKEVS